MFCIGHSCFYAKESNLEWTSIVDMKPDQSYLSIKMRNDCRGKKCCLPQAGGYQLCTL